MPKYFVFANSFAAPFFSDPSTGYTTGDTPEDALRSFAESYNHPYGLYAAVLYESADAYHKKDHDPLCRWLCNEAAFLEGKVGSIRKEQDGHIFINDVEFVVENPKDGHIV